MINIIRDNLISALSEVSERIKEKYVSKKKPLKIIYGKKEYDLKKELFEELKVKNSEIEGDKTEGDKREKDKEEISFVFVDGSNNKLLRMHGLTIHKVRIAVLVYPEKEIEMINNYLIEEESEGNPEDDHENNPKKIIYDYKNQFQGKDVDEIRTIMEYYYGKEIMERYTKDSNGKERILVIDGSLEEVPKEGEVLGISKDTQMVLDNGIPVQSYFKKMKGEWIYPLEKQKIGDYIYSINLVKMNEKGIVLRVDYYGRRDIKEVINRLKSMSSDILRGYPYPLIRAHQLSIIHKKDLQKEKQLLLTFLKDKEEFIATHELLDEIS